MSGFRDRPRRPGRRTLPGMTPPATTVAGWTLGAELGRGASGVVHAARRPGDAADAAMKRLGPGVAADPLARRRFLRGAAVQASLQHAGVLAVLDHGEDPEAGPFVVTPRCRGGSLRDRLAAGVSPRELLALLEPVAAALDVAHAAGVVHRDVKPSNVLLDQDRAFLTDFGLARFRDDEDATVAGGVIGTLAYVAPEVVRGAPASAASDRYALAGILVEGLTGEPVFPRTTDAALLYAHVDAAPPLLSDRRPELGPAIDGILAAALAKDPEARPTSCAGLLRDVGAALGQRGLALGPVGPPRRVVPAADDRTLAGGESVGDADGHDADGSWPDAGGPGPADPARAIDGPGSPRRAAGAGRSTTDDDGRRRPGRRRRWIGAATTAGVAGVVALLLSTGGDDRAAGDDTPAPAVARGTVVLGADLAPGTLERAACALRRSTEDGEACSVVPVRLPGRRLRVPTDGAVRAWAVRGAGGELALQVLRRRAGRIFQVARSQTTVVVGEGAHRYPVELAVEAGDELALALTPASHIGVRPDAGARAERYLRPVGGEVPVATGGDRLLQGAVALRVELDAGGVPTPPRQIVGAAAARLPAGRTVGVDETTLPDGRRVRVVLRAVGGQVVADLERGGRRRARIVVPDCDPAGRPVELKAFRSPGDPSQLNVGWLNPGSERPVEHYFGLDTDMFEFYS